MHFFFFLENNSSLITFVIFSFKGKYLYLFYKFILDIYLYWKTRQDIVYEYLVNFSSPLEMTFPLTDVIMTVISCHFVQYLR